MNKNQAVFLAVFTAWPLIYMGLFLFLTIFMVISNIVSPSEKIPQFFVYILPIHFLTIFEIFGLIIFYIIDIFKTNRVDNDKKALWAVVIFLGNIFAMPVYWYLYIWKNLKKRDDQILKNE